MTLSPALAQALAAGRPQYNARIAAARRAHSGFDTDALTYAIRIRLDPLVTAVDAIAPDRTVAVTDAGLDVLVTLVGHDLAGHRRLLVDRVWAEMAVAGAALVAQDPFTVLAMLSNAVLTIDQVAGARPEVWIARMAAILPQIADSAMLAAAGQVVAWRSGMAHYRDGALAVADSLPEALALAAVGATGNWAEIRAALAANPWWSPDGDAAAGIRFGGFTGFGGPFVDPPRIRAGEGGFFVRSGGRTAFLIADACGATSHPASDEEYDGADTAAATIHGTMLVAGDRTVPIDLPAGGLRAVVAGNSVLVASPYSHVVRVLPWRLP